MCRYKQLWSIKPAGIKQFESAGDAGILVCRGEWLQRTKNKATGCGWEFPEPEEIEKHVYRNAVTLEEYQKHSTFSIRIPKIYEEWRKARVRS